MSVPVYKLEGRTIHKLTQSRKIEGGNTHTVGFPVCTVSEWVSPESVLGILEEYERFANMPGGIDAVEGDNIIIAPVFGRIDIPVERVLKQAYKQKLVEAVVLGTAENGDFYFSVSLSDSGGVLWLLELGKKLLFDAVED